MNGDGYTDLVVGAPFYEATGAVYIYLNGPKGITNDKRFKIEGQEAEGRFGFALANAGDLNNDGFADLIVGAPYEDSGKVYVFNGAEKLTEFSPSQVMISATLQSEGSRNLCDLSPLWLFWAQGWRQFF